MKFHCHITVPAFSGITPHGWKQTTIHLEKDNTIVEDLMFTKHYVIGYRGISSQEDIFSDALKIGQSCGAIRVKVEKESDFDLDEILSNTRYMEYHLLVASENCGLSSSWKRSRNPKRKNKEGTKEFFYTRRIRSGSVGDSVGRVDEELRDLKGHSLLDLKQELVVLDTFPGHDSWWA